MGISNPRFPHRCRIYRMEGATSFESGEAKVLYEGECRKQTNTSLRTFRTSGVIKGDYSLSLPGTVGGILPGDLIDVTDRQGGWKGCMVSDAYAGNLGTTVYFNMGHN